MMPLHVAAVLASAAPLPCALTAADKVANAALSFDDFDQRGALPSTARALANRSCHAEAVDAMEDYLVNGPARTDGGQRIIVWHMAQSLAMLGRDREAARLMAGARTPGRVNDRIDWDAYVAASRAFLARDRAAFDAAAARLAASTREPDRINGAIVAGMGRCWDKPYRMAYDADCGK